MQYHKTFSGNRSVSPDEARLISGVVVPGGTPESNSNQEPATPEIHTTAESLLADGDPDKASDARRMAIAQTNRTTDATPAVQETATVTIPGTKDKPDIAVTVVPVASVSASTNPDAPKPPESKAEDGTKSPETQSDNTTVLQQNLDSAMKALSPEQAAVVQEFKSLLSSDERGALTEVINAMTPEELSTLTSGAMKIMEKFKDMSPEEITRIINLPLLGEDGNMSEETEQQLDALGLEEPEKELLKRMALVMQKPTEQAPETSEPKTHREALEQRMKDLNAKLENPNLQSMEALTTTLEMLGTIVEMIKRALGGTLDEPIEQDGMDKKSAEAPAGAPAATPAATPQVAVEADLQAKGAATLEQRSTALTEIAQESQAGIEKNETAIARIGTDLKSSADKKKQLDTGILEGEQELLAEQSKPENERNPDVESAIQTQLDGLKREQTAVEQTIKEQLVLKKKLEEENAVLTKKKEAAEKMKSGTDFTIEQVGKVEKTLEKLLHAKVKFEIDDGKQHMVVSELSEDTPSWAKGVLESHDADTDAANGYQLDLKNAQWLSDHPEDSKQAELEPTKEQKQA